MRLSLMSLLMISLAIGCGGDEEKGDGEYTSILRGEAEEPTHSSCEAMDDAGIVSRLDGIVSSNRDIIDLNGHCFVNSDNNALGEVMAMRFVPYTDDGSTPIMHLQMYWIPPTHTQAIRPRSPSSSTKRSATM